MSKSKRNRTIHCTGAKNTRIDNDDSLSDRAGRASINGHERFESIDHSQIKHREYTSRRYITTLEYCSRFTLALITFHDDTLFLRKLLKNDFESTSSRKLSIFLSIFYVFLG